MKYYRMSNRFTEDWDGLEPTALYKDSHSFFVFNSGHKLFDYSKNKQGDPFVGPLVCNLDDEDETGVFPTFYMSPALIGTKNFYNDLLDLAVSNIDVHSVVIKDQENDREIHDYVLLNVIGRIQCADMDKSDVSYLGDDKEIAIIDRLVIDSKKVANANFFLIAEDTSCVVVDEKVYSGLIERGYKDIHFEEIETA